jgi:hypothetical protein
MELDTIFSSNEYEKPIGPLTFKSTKKQAARAKTAAKAVRKASRRDAVSGVVMSSTSGIKKKRKPRPTKTDRVAKAAAEKGKGEEEMKEMSLPEAMAILNSPGENMSVEAIPAGEGESARAGKKVEEKKRALLAAAEALVVRAEMEKEQKEKDKLEHQRSRKGKVLDVELVLLEKEQTEHAERLGKHMGEIKDEAHRARKKRTPTAVKGDIAVDDLAAMLGLVGMGRKHGK